MTRLPPVLLAVALWCGAAVAADSPPAAVPASNAPPAAASAASAASTTSAATPANPAAEAAARSASAGGLTEAEVKRAFAKFRKQQRDGKTLYCRKETPMGSRLGSTVCYSEEQVLANARAERDAGQMQSQQNVCGGGSCSPGGG